MAKTTAVSRYNVVATFNSGKIGNVRLYQKGGKSYVRAAYNSALSNPRSPAQMRQRLKWANLSKTWTVLKPYLEQSFEGSTPYRSTVNLFMRANIAAGNGIYLSKELNSRNMVKNQPFVVSMGSLAPVSSSFVQQGLDTYIVSDLGLAAGVDVSTIGSLSRNLLNSNPDHLKIGDKITMLVVLETSLQRIGAVPFIRPFCTSFTLNVNDDTPQSNWLEHNGMLSFLGSVDVADKFSCAFILSRNDGSLLTSSATLTCTPSCDYANFQTQSAFESAAASYGTSTSVYLNPRTGAALYSVDLSVMTGQSTFGTVQIGDEVGMTSGMFQIGTELTLKAIPASGYSFASWSDGVATAERQIIVDSSLNLVAEFVAQ